MPHLTNGKHSLPLSALRFTLAAVLLCCMTATGCQIPGHTGNEPVSNTSGQTAKNPVSESAVDSSVQPDGPASTAGSLSDTENHAGNPSTDQSKLLSSRQLETAEHFLKKNAKDNNYRYYSIVTLESGEQLLLTSERVIQIDESDNPSSPANQYYGSSACEVFRLADDGLTSLGLIACSSGGDWIRLSPEGRLTTSTHHSIISYTLCPDGDKLTEDTLTDKPSDELYKRKSYEYSYQSTGILFFTNPWSSQKPAKGKEPSALKPQPDITDRTLRKILSYEIIQQYADLTGDGSKDLITISMDQVRDPENPTNSLCISASRRKKLGANRYSAEAIYGIPVGTSEGRQHCICLFHENSRTYLLDFHLSGTDQKADFLWKIFSLTPAGSESILVQDSLSLDLAASDSNNQEKLTAFLSGLNSRLEKSELLINTIGGREQLDTEYQDARTYADGEQTLHFDSDELLKSVDRFENEINN